MNDQLSLSEAQPLAQAPESNGRPLADTKQLRTEAVGALLGEAYQGASQLKLNKDECKKLREDFPDEQIEIRPHDGIIYISHMALRERLWEVFGPGHVAEICRERFMRADANEIAVDLVLMIRGCFAAEAVGTAKYFPNNPKMTFGDVVESAWSEALRRCCKKFGVGTQVSRFWIASFYDAAGRLRRRSTKETNRAKALEVARLFEKAAKGAGSPQHIRQVVSDFLRERGRAELPPTASVRGYCEQWLSPRRAETSPVTWRKYHDGCQAFLEYLGPRARCSLDEISRADVVGFRDAALKRLAPATVNGYLKLIRRVFRTARQDGVLIVDPAEAVKAVRGRGEPARRPFTLAELAAVLAAADVEWASMVRIGFFTALRLGDIARLQWPQVDFQRGEIRLTAAKTGRRMVLPIPATLRQHLVRYAGNPRRLSGPLHPNAYETVSAQAGRTGALSNQFRALLVAAGLRPPAPHRSRGIGRSNRRTASEITFHSLRHTHVSMLTDAGVPDAVTMAIAGHESVSMSARYTHVGTDAMRKATETLPEI